MRARRAKRNPLLPVGGADESLAGCLHYRDGSRWASEDRRLRGLSAACSDTGPREPRLSDRYSRPSACVAMRNWSWEIGRASCRERVEIAGVGGTVKKKKVKKRRGSRHSSTNSNVVRVAWSNE